MRMIQCDFAGHDQGGRSTPVSSRALSISQQFKESVMEMSGTHKSSRRFGIDMAFAPLVLALFFSGVVHAQEKAPVATLDAVVVTASGMEQSAKDAPASLTVITQEDIKKSGYTSVAQAVSKVEGVYMVGGDPNSRDIAIRGLPGEYTL